MAVIEQYIAPVTSAQPVPEDTYRFTHQPPASINFCALAQLCEYRFSFGSRSGILGKFNKKVWPAALMRTIVHNALTPEDNQLPSVTEVRHLLLCTA